LQALAQFGRWEALLDEPQPDADLDYSNAVWHYARGLAHANLGDLEAARDSHAALVELQGSEKVEFLVTVGYPGTDLLGIADALLAGEIALIDGELDSAIEHFEQAVAIQDALPYTEPPFWYYPTRQSLGVALLAAGRDADAEAVYRRDLVDYPRNGWSLYGLMQSLEAQGRAADAEEIRSRFEAVWSLADVTLTASRL
jgi:tetratricopeptide (TPR) repeat protein